MQIAGIVGVSLALVNVHMFNVNVITLVICYVNALMQSVRLFELQS